MKKSIHRILSAWVFLLCFITGQYMVYAHQHYINKNAHSIVCHSAKSSSQPAFTEKCSLCDSMHHFSMETSNAVSCHTISSTDLVFNPDEYDFTSVALILSPGRAPPTA